MDRLLKPTRKELIAILADRIAKEADNAIAPHREKLKKLHNRRVSIETRLRRSQDADHQKAIGKAGEIVKSLALPSGFSVTHCQNNIGIKYSSDKTVGLALEVASARQAEQSMQDEINKMANAVRAVYNDNTNVIDISLPPELAAEFDELAKKVVITIYGM